MSIKDLSDTIIAKSDQLNADDLVGADRVITVTGVSRGNAENPLIINYEGDSGRPFKPCKTVRRILIAAWGADGTQWNGLQAQLWCDPSVVYAGKEVGGIRIRALSGISKPLSVKLSVTRGKKKEYRIEVLKPPQKDYCDADTFKRSVDKASAKIASGEMTPEQIINKLESKYILSDEQRAEIRVLSDAAPLTDDLMSD